MGLYYIWILWRSRKCSEPLSHLPSPVYFLNRRTHAPWGTAIFLNCHPERASATPLVCFQKSFLSMWMCVGFLEFCWRHCNYQVCFWPESLTESASLPLLFRMPLFWHQDGTVSSASQDCFAPCCFSPCCTLDAYVLRGLAAAARASHLCVLVADPFISSALGPTCPSSLADALLFLEVDRRFDSSLPSYRYFKPNTS